MNANGSLTYTPDADWSGTDSFTYKASDGTLDSDPATVTIVTTSSDPQPPVLDPLGSRSGTVGQLLTFTVSAVDPNGDPLTYSASGLPSGASFNATTHTFTWTPSAAGTFTGVRFTVFDGSLSDFEDITITISAAPTLTEITRSVATGTDDGFSGSWGFYTSQTWYEAGTPGQPYSAWFRFTGITIPAGATILEAHLETMHAAWVSGTTLKISAEKAPAPTAPTSTANHAGRVRTTTSVNWTSGYSDWAWHNSPDFASVIQELVNSYDYSSGGTVQLLVDDNGSSSGSEHDGETFESGYLPRLYIKYQITPAYMVIYNANGADSGTVPANQVKTPGVDLILATNTGNLVRAGYIFAGWNTAAAGNGTHYDAGASYTADAGMTLYAQWTSLLTYTVTYDGNGAGSGIAPIDSGNYLAGATVTVLGNTGSLVKTGYTFAGWNTAANGSGTAYMAGNTFTIGSSNVTLYAQWTSC